MIKELKQELVKALGYLKGQKFEAEKIPDENIKISERVVGGKVEAVDAEGNLTPIPDGDYQLQDGFKFTVKDGLISQIHEDEKEEGFEDVATLQIGDEVTINPEAKEYMEWYNGVKFVVNSLDGYGEGLVGLTNAKGVYVTCTKPESVTKTGNKVELPKDEAFEEVEESKDEAASLNEAVDALKAETESLKAQIAEIKAVISEFAGKSDVEEFKKEIVKLNKTIETVAKIPVENSKTTKSNFVKDSNKNDLEEVVRLLRK